MSTANYTAEGLLILTVEQETQILNQMETAIKLMQGKITLKQAQPSLGKIVYQSTDIVSFQPLFPTPNQKVYSHLRVSLLGLTEAQFEEKNISVDPYLKSATFNFTDITGIPKEKLVERLGLRAEEYIGIADSTAPNPRPRYIYRYDLPKNSKTPYKTHIQMVFWDEGTLIGRDRKGRGYYKGATRLEYVDIMRTAY